MVADVHHGESRLPAMARAIVLKAGDNLTGRDFQVGLDRILIDDFDPLTPSWTRYDIMLDSLKPAPNAPAALKAWTWKQGAKEMTAIDFKASYPSSTSGDTSLFTLDDVRLQGVSLGASAP